MAPLCRISHGTRKSVFERSMLPKLFASAPFQQISSVDGIEENLLLLFHGLGDTPGPFTSLAKTLALPQTTCIALGAPHAVPLSDGGRSWFTFLDSETFELIPGQQAEKRRIRSMHSTVDALEQLLLHLHVYCGWDSRKVHLFGFSQGGTVAMEVALRYAVKGKELGSCIAIASGLLEEQLSNGRNLYSAADSNTKNTTKVPVLLLHGDKDTVVSRERVIATEVLLNKNGMDVEFRNIPGKGHSMISSEAETRILMEFWAKHLSNRPPAGENDDGGEEAPSSDIIEIAPGVASISLA